EEVHYQVQHVQEDLHGDKRLDLVSPINGSRAVLHLSDMWQDLPVQPGDSLNVIRPRDQGCEQSVRQLVCSASEGLCVLHPDILLSGTTVTSAMDCTRKAWLSELFGGGANNDKAVLGTLSHELVQEEVHYQVQHVQEDLHGDKRLDLVSPINGSRAVLHLSNMWQDLPVQPGDSLNVIRPRDQGCEQGVRQLVCSASEGLCVLHPDILLSGTTVTSAMDCTRKAWLSELFGGGANNDKAVLGTLSHELVQWALLAAVQGPMRLPSRAQCVTQAHEIVAASASKLFEVGVSADVAVRALTDKVTALLAWLAKYVGAGHAGPRDLVMGPNHQGPATQVLVEEVVDIEESIWAPQYGLKGQLDATLRVDSLVPFEYKSGKPHFSHRAQLSLYFLLLDDRLAAHLVGKQRLPPAMLRNERQCGTCFAATYCALVHKALEGGDEASSGMRPQQWSGLTSHLGPSHGQFLRHWLGLVELEDSAAREGRSALWAVPGRQRELQGSCLADLQLQDTLVVAAKKEIRMMEPYLRQPQSEGLPPLPTQPGTAQPPCAANRAVLPSAAAVLWRLDKDEAAAGVTQQRTNLLMLMEAASGQVARLRDLVVDLAPPRMVAEQQRTNLLMLMEAASGQVARLRELVVDLAPPRMVAEQAARCEASSDLAVACSHLNSEQQAAVQAVLQMQDYTLILGMPGTGKTSTTVCAIQAMVAAGRSVLLTAYTNSAVDNICLKLAAAAVQFVRLPGSSLDAVHPGVRGHTPGGERYPAGNSAEGLTQLAADVKVVAVTCLGVRHPLLARRSFDVCVLDEASQVALPASLGPLSLASSFVLVGDHHQLPPLVTNPAAAAQGMSESLFKQLSEAHPQAVVQLCRQYRMAEEIQVCCGWA
ncbi:uncharacterized protein HaLaN_09362, partial [Haematococcus lacustris]